MIKTLRLKFIAISFLSLFIVLFVVVCGLNVLNYKKAVADNNRIQSILDANNDRVPARDRPMGDAPYDIDDFAPEPPSLSNLPFFLAASVVISTLGMIFFMILVTLLSKRMMRPVSESYEKQKRFITDAGHEIKTPLTIIGADLSILEMELGENEWLSDIHLQTQRLTDLTQDLIFLSRMEESQYNLPMIPFPLSDILLETAQSFQALARIQEKTFHIHVQPRLSFCGDEKSMRQLLSILLDNALKYSNEYGSICLTAKAKGTSIYLYIDNTVSAVHEASLPHLFDRFYRTDASRNSETGGYGIGLSIAKAIVLAHKGTITASYGNETSLRITVIL